MMTSLHVGRVGMLRLGLTCLALVLLAGLIGAGRANATHLDPSDAFYWSLPGLNRPVGHDSAIAVSPDGNLVYVADGLGNAIEEYTSDGVGKRVIRFGRRPFYPSGITTDLSGNVYVVYEATGTVAKFNAHLQFLTSWSVPFARSIAADRAGHVWVLTKFFNAVGEYDSNGNAIGGFAANLPGQLFPNPCCSADYYPQSGYDDPYKTVANVITIDRSGDPVVAGASYQALGDPQPDCHVAIDFNHIDIQPYDDPLVSGEVARFRPDGTPVSWGWLSTSPMACWNMSSDRTSPDGVAVDPNAGDVFTTTDAADRGHSLGMVHMTSGLQNTRMDLNAPSYYCATITCAARDWDLIAGNAPQGVAFDCRSDLYMLSDNPNARFVTKFINSDYVPQAACSPLLQRLGQRPQFTLFRGFGVSGPGKVSVPGGCGVKLCRGSITLKVSSPLCRGCDAGFPIEFNIPAGARRTLTLGLTQLGRKLLRQHPGLAIELVAKLQDGRSVTERELLREPAALSRACTFPRTLGGAATVSGTLSPSPSNARITIEYIPPGGEGALIPAVQRTVIAGAGGRFSDQYQLGQAGRWTVVASWSGDRTHQAAVAVPCGGTVAKATTHLNLTCPRAASIHTPASFTGQLSGATGRSKLAILYLDPSGAVTVHALSSGAAGGFSDSFAPTAPGGWQAIAHFDGDADHAAAVAACQFSVAQPTANDFSISVNPSSGSVLAGGAASATVDTAVISGSPQSISIGSSGASPGTVSVTPSSVTAGGSATLNIQTTAATPPGTYVITITGTGSSATHSTTYTLTVVEQPTSISLSCSLGPASNVISCSGQLTAGGTGLGGAPVTVTYQPPAPGSSTAHSTTTDAAGNYSDSFGGAAGPPLTSGTWTVQAQFAGDGSHGPASVSQSVNVP